MIEMYQAGERSGAIAESVGINRKTVTTIVRRNGRIVRTQKTASGRPRFQIADWQDRVVSLRQQGMSQQAIGRGLGMSQAVVGRILANAGLPTQLRRTGAAHGSWKGGIVTTAGGYLHEAVPATDPLASMRNRMGYVPQHRLVMARSLGRPLESHETVHHINGKRDDSRRENLQLRQGRHGKGVRHVCGDCGSSNIITASIGTED